MLDHIAVTVTDLARSRGFYQRLLAPLGYRELMALDEAAGFGAPLPERPGEQSADFWIEAGGPQQPPVHVAFGAAERSAVDRFYAAALAAGGRDNGPPGLRPHYHPNYYAAFILDPDGHNIEAVCHRAE